MKLLIDTHVFIWMQTDMARLSPAARAAVAAPGNPLYVSAVVAWELAIKVPLDKFTLADPVEFFVVEGIRRIRAIELPVSVRHAAAVATLPLHHADPFDRLLLAQASVEGNDLGHGRPQAAAVRRSHPVVIPCPRPTRSSPPPRGPTGPGGWTRPTASTGRSSRPAPATRRRCSCSG